MILKGNESIVLFILFASIKLSLFLFLGQLFFFMSFITLTLLRCSYCILGGLCGTTRINLLGQWLSHLRKFNRIRDFRYQQQQSKMFVSWLKLKNQSTMSTLPTPRRRLQPLPSCYLISHKLRSSLAKISIVGKNAFILY